MDEYFIKQQSNSHAVPSPPLRPLYPSYVDLDPYIDVERLKSLDLYLRDRLDRRMVRASDLKFYTGPFPLDGLAPEVRDWEPRGPVLVVAELVYSVTDPPLRALRKVLKPVRIGNVLLDLAFIGLYILVSILMRVNRAIFF